MPAIAFLTERMRLGFGVDLLVDQLATGLTARGHSVTVFTCFTDGTYEGGPYRIVSLPVPSRPEALAWDWQAWLAARGSGLFDLPFDVWFALTPPFFSLLPLLRGRGVAVDCGVSDSTGMSRRQRANFRATEFMQQRWYFRSAARIVTISHWLGSQLPSSLQARTVPILLGADHYPVASATARATCRHRLGVADGEVLCLYVGRLNPHAQPYKGTERLLAMHREIAASHPQARLALVGFGDEDDAAWIRANGAIPVVNAPVTEMPALFAAADLYVTASSWEGFDLPLVEAQRSGKGVVAFRIGAHPEVVDDGRSGFLVNDDGEFVAMLKRLVGDPMLRDEVGEAASHWGSRFRWADTVAKYDQLVDELVDQLGFVLPGLRGEQTDRVQADRSLSDEPALTHGMWPASGDCFGHPPVSALILNYGADEDTLVRCVASVLSSRCRRVLEVVVADNGSQRHLAALDAIAALDERVRVVRLGQNFGFAGGINRGLALCRGDWILILNNDTEVDPLAIDACAEVLAAEAPECLAAVPKLLLRGFPGVFDAVGNAIDPMGRAFNVGIGQLDVGQYDASMRVFGPCFAAALFRREAFDVDKVGPLDGSYFMYYEDVDWSWRANLLGYRFQSAPMAKVHHDHSKTTRERPHEFKMRQIHGHLLTTIVKNMPPRSAYEVSSYHLRRHVGAALRGDMTVSRLRLIAGAAARLPDALAKHRWVRRRRVVPDEDVVALGKVEATFFDAETYSPILDLSNVSAAYRRKWTSTGDPRWLEVAERAVYLAGHGATTEPGVLRRLLLPLLEGEADVVVDLVRRLDPACSSDADIRRLSDRRPAVDG